MVKFRVHGGYGKTGTTYLQEKIFSSLDDFLFLGKGFGARMVSPDFEKIYHKLFPTISELSPAWPRNSSLLIEKIGEIILKEMRSSKKRKFLLSDECLIDYGNYNAELNMHLIKRLCDYLQDHYEEEIDFQVMMTIRSQKDSLSSFFAYDYGHLKSRFSSYERFIEFGLENPHEIVFGGYHYDLVLAEMRKVFGADNVRFFVYEKMKEEIGQYVQEILDFLGTGQSLESLDYQGKVNVNSSGGVHRVREFKKGFLGNLLEKSYNRGRGLLQPLEKAKAFQSAKRMAEDYANRSAKVVDHGNLGELPENLVDPLENIYRDSNRRLAKMLEIPLDTYGYVGGVL